jgi:O-antigen ligase
MSARPTEQSAAGAAQATSAVGVRLAQLWVVVAFSNFPVYLFTFVFPSLLPLYWLGGLFVLTFLVLYGADAIDRDRAPVFLATLALYACMCLVWYVAQGGGEPVILRQRLLSLAVCGAAYLAFAASAPALQAARRALVLMVLLAVVVNMWDITHPFALVPADSESSVVGRAAGFFINPNQAGAALVAGFALSVSVLPRRWRVPYLVLVALGVGLTFSRAAILGLVLVGFLLAFRGRSLSLRQLAAAMIILGAVSWIIWLFVSAELEERFHIDPQIALDRLLWVLDPTGEPDFSEWDRIQLVQRGWAQFLGSPFVGNGVGSTELWDSHSSTHNIYVQLASDFGVIGLLVLPAIMLAAIGSWPGRLTDAVVTALFMLFWGLFSHNVLGEYYLLLTISLVAALSRRETAAAHAGEEQEYRALPA